MRKLLFGIPIAIAMIAFASCDDSELPSAPDANVSEASPFDAAPADAQDGGKPKLTSCVDRPATLDRPPTGRLPCELVPPGLTL